MKTNTIVTHIETMDLITIINKSAIASCILTAIVILAGCGDSNKGKSILFGSVTYQGKLIERGQIRFIPQNGNELPMSSALIIDGKYRIDRKGGVPEGTYKVSIEAFVVPTKYANHANHQKAPGPNAPLLQYLPEKFNRATALTITIGENSGSVANDFNLTN